METNDERPVKSSCTFRLTDSEKEQLNAIALRYHSNKSEFLRERIRQILKTESK